MEEEISYSNALGTGMSININMNKEVITNCVPVTDNEMKILDTALKQAEDNQVRIEIVMDNKEGKLFSSKQILAICQTTPSLKTRKAILHMIGPRITDIKNSASIVDLFSASADRSEIEGIFRTVSTLKSSKKLAGTPTSKSPIVMGGRGKGGRGRLANAATKVVNTNRALQGMTPKNKKNNEGSSAKETKQEESKSPETVLNEENNKLNNLHGYESPSISPISNSTPPSVISTSSNDQIFFAPNKEKGMDGLCDSSDIDQSSSNTISSPKDGESSTKEKGEDMKKSNNMKKEIRRARSSIRMANPLSLLSQSTSPRDRTDESVSSSVSFSEQDKANDSNTKKEIRRARSSIRMANPLSLLSQSTSPRDSTSISPIGEDTSGLPPSPKANNRASKRKSRYILSGSISISDVTISEPHAENAPDESEEKKTNHDQSETVSPLSSSKCEQEKSESDVTTKDINKSSTKSMSLMSSLFNNTKKEEEKTSLSDALTVDSSIYEKPSVVESKESKEDKVKVENQTMISVHDPMEPVSPKRASSFVNSSSTKEEILKDAKLIEEKALRFSNQNLAPKLKELIQKDTPDKDIPTNTTIVSDSEENITEFLSYDEILQLKSRKDFARIRPDQLEKYLSDEEFLVVMEMSKDKFYSLAAWKQKKIKQDKNLF